MGVHGVPGAAELLGMTKGGVRKAIARKTLAAVLVTGGRRGAEYAVTDAEIRRYRQAHRRPGHRRAVVPEPTGLAGYDWETEGVGGT